MRQIPFSQDDLLDVMEMTDKIEASIAEICEGNENALSLSALISAHVNIMLFICNTLDEVVHYRNTFMQVLDDAILDLQAKQSRNDRDK
jgi:hypothetical protein